MRKTMGKPTYQEWKKAINDYLWEEWGVTADDLPDCPYRNWYEEDVPATEAAMVAVRNAVE